MRIVVKVGTSTLAHGSGKLNFRRVENLCKVLSDINNAEHEVVLVSSGAIGMGVGKLGLKERPKEMYLKQAAAAVGQCELMYIYDKLFSEYSHTVAQILITADDIKNECRVINFKNTLDGLLKLGVIPIINENDTLATEEISVGDNDTLAAIITTSVKADVLVILSDIDGLYTADPNTTKDAKVIKEVAVIDDSIISVAGGVGSKLGTGGMVTKINAAKICMQNGIDMFLTNGEFPEKLYDILNGKQVGTKFIGVR